MKIFKKVLLMVMVLACIMPITGKTLSAASTQDPTITSITLDNHGTHFDKDNYGSLDIAYKIEGTGLSNVTTNDLKIVNSDDSNPVTPVIHESIEHISDNEIILSGYQSVDVFTKTFASDRDQIYFNVESSTLKLPLITYGEPFNNQTTNPVKDAYGRDFYPGYISNGTAFVYYIHMENM